jgi:predicted porin
MAMYGSLMKATGCSINCDDTEATSMMVGAKYLFSKKTGVYVSYNATTNKANSNLDYTAASMTSANPLALGADPRIIAIGIMQNF